MFAGIEENPGGHFATAMLPLVGRPMEGIRYETPAGPAGVRIPAPAADARREACNRARERLEKICAWLENGGEVLGESLRVFLHNKITTWHPTWRAAGAPGHVGAVGGVVVMAGLPAGLFSTGAAGRYRPRIDELEQLWGDLFAES